MAFLGERIRALGKFPLLSCSPARYLEVLCLIQMDYSMCRKCHRRMNSKEILLALSLTTSPRDNLGFRFPRVHCFTVALPWKCLDPELSLF